MWADVKLEKIRGGERYISEDCFKRPVADVVMDMDSLDFLAKHIDCSRLYVCADSKQFLRFQLISKLSFNVFSSIPKDT